MWEGHISPPANEVSARPTPVLALLACVFMCCGVVCVEWFCRSALNGPVRVILLRPEAISR
jgi:hypothetical protein